jgi:hypothetical protein
MINPTAGLMVNQMVPALLRVQLHKAHSMRLSPYM